MSPDCSVAAGLHRAFDGVHQALPKIAENTKVSAFEITDKLALEQKLEAGNGLVGVEVAHGNFNVLTTYRRWSQAIGGNPDYFYRGMALNPGDIEFIRAHGILRDKAGFIFDGIFADKRIDVVIPYALSLKRRKPGGNLAVIYEIDPKGLILPGPGSLTKFPDDIPPTAIKRVLIFDPNADIKGVPFVEMSTGK